MEQQKIIFTPLSYTKDGHIKVHVKRPMTKYTAIYSPQRLKEVIEDAKLYCAFKGYKFSIDNTKWEEDAHAIISD